MQGYQKNKVLSQNGNERFLYQQNCIVVQSSLAAATAPDQCYRFHAVFGKFEFF